ncbi:hypothetical protein [Tabrizicola sp.]|uniref:hypothetical protein n=1 Tax=Tabrizicola sp. TaxID=2005166 RepID=UPI003F408D35
MLGDLGLIILGGLITYLLSMVIAKLTNDQNEITEHVAEIIRVEEAAVAYWVYDPSKEPLGSRAKELAAKLQGQMLCTSAFRERAEKLLGDSFDEYRELDGKLFDTSTGGSFGSPERSADFERVIEIIGICHQLRNVLRRSRSRRYWAH